MPRRALLLYVLVVVVLRIPSYCEPILNIDEADFAVQTAVWMEGGRPYVDFIAKKPPLIHLVYALAFWLGGPWNMLAVHLLYTGIAILTGLLLARVARAWGGNRAGLATLWLYAVYHVGYDLNDFLAANTETVLNGCAALALWSLVTRRWVWFAGWWLGWTGLAKQAGVALGMAWAMAYWREWRLLLRLACGALVPILLLGLLGWRFGVLDEARDWLWGANLAYAGAPAPLGQLLRHGMTRVTWYLAASLPLWGLAARAGGDRQRLTWLWGWVGFSLVAMAPGWRFFPHYFLQLVPPLTLLAGLGWTRWVPSPQLRRFAIGCGLLLPALGCLGLHIAEVRQLPALFRVERAIGAYLAQVSDPGDRVFVWGHNADIYYYARRLPASRFVYCAPLTGAREGFEAQNVLTPTDPALWELLSRDFESHPPRWIVEMAGTDIRGYGAFPFAAYPWWREILAADYEPAAILYGARLYRRRRA